MPETPKQRAQRGAKGLSFLEAGHVPERLVNDLKSLKESYAALESMSEEEVRQFITRIINFRDQLSVPAAKSRLMRARTELYARVKRRWGATKHMMPLSSKQSFPARPGHQHARLAV
jgi:hypothetical protein